MPTNRGPARALKLGSGVLTALQKVTEATGREKSIKGRPLIEVRVTSGVCVCGGGDCQLKSALSHVTRRDGGG